MARLEGKGVLFGRWFGSAVTIAAASLVSGVAVAQPVANVPVGEIHGITADGMSSGNCGNLNKVQALRGIQDIIASFGGNPDRVTVGGQSAGARGICFLLASPEAAGLFHGAIVESSGNCAATSMEASLANGEKYVEHVGCTDADDRLACLREKAPGEILAAQASSGIRGGIVYGGGEMPKDVVDAFQSGEFNRVPVMIGNTSTETVVFTYEAFDLQSQPVIPADYEAAIKSRMGDRADEAFAAYADLAAKSPGLALGHFNADRSYACATPQVIDALAKWTSTYAYVFADSTAPLRSYASVPPSFELGAPHSAELPYLWGENTVPNGLTTDQQRLAKMMRGYLVSPTDPDGMVASDLPEWPVYTPDSQQRLVLKPGGNIEIISQSDYLAPHNCELFE